MNKHKIDCHCYVTGFLDVDEKKKISNDCLTCSESNARPPSTWVAARSHQCYCNCNIHIMAKSKWLLQANAGD